METIWWNNVVTYIAGGDYAVLLTVAGLGVFLKLLLIPLIKLFSINVYPKKEMTGLVTIIIVHIAALVTVILVTLIFKKPFAFGPMILVAWAATKDAIGINESVKAIRCPDQI